MSAGTGQQRDLEEITRALLLSFETSVAGQGLGIGAGCRCNDLPVPTQSRVNHGRPICPDGSKYQNPVGFELLRRNA
eukprot:1439018-Amphidinium_carterae.1